MKKGMGRVLSAIIAICMTASLLPNLVFASGAANNSNAILDKTAYSRKCVNYYYTDSGELVKDVLLDTMTHYNAVPSINNAAPRDGYYKANYIDRLGRNYSSANGHDIAL